jgi:hypothetical protein
MIFLLIFLSFGQKIREVEPNFMLFSTFCVLSLYAKSKFYGSFYLSSAAGAQLRRRLLAGSCGHPAH